MLSGYSTEYTECQAFSVVRIGSPTPSPPSSVALPPFGSKGDALAHALAGEGAGVANSDEGTDTLVL
jgi:hypothetical protein